jgi:hypothetical protein
MAALGPRYQNEDDFAKVKKRTSIFGLGKPREEPPHSE